MGSRSAQGGGNGAGGGPALRISAEQACTVLYRQLPPLDSRLLTSSLQALVGQAEVEWGRIPAPGTPLVAGTARFGSHRVVMIALPAPVSRDVLERTVGVSPMPDGLRAALMAHRAAIRLLYVGDSDAPIEQLAALYIVAGALLELDGLGVINERAALALPTERVVEYLIQLGEGVTPIPLWVGVVTFNLDEDEDDFSNAYLMRTYGMEQMRLPDLCILMSDRAQQADDLYHALMNICLYMTEGPSGRRPKEGDRMDFGNRSYLLAVPGEDVRDVVGSGQALMLVEV